LAASQPTMKNSGVHWILKKTGQGAPPIARIFPLINRFPSMVAEKALRPLPLFEERLFPGASKRRQPFFSGKQEANGPPSHG